MRYIFLAVFLLSVGCVSYPCDQACRDRFSADDDKKSSPSYGYRQGSRIYYNNGTSAYTQGNFVYRNDGTTGYIQGNRIYNSDGSVGVMQGQSIYQTTPTR